MRTASGRPKMGVLRNETPFAAPFAARSADKPGYMVEQSAHMLGFEEAARKASKVDIRAASLNSIDNTMLHLLASSANTQPLHLGKHE